MSSEVLGNQELVSNISLGVGRESRRILFELVYISNPSVSEIMSSMSL